MYYYMVAFYSADLCRVSQAPVGHSHWRSNSPNRISFETQGSAEQHTQFYVQIHAHQYSHKASNCHPSHHHQAPHTTFKAW